MTTKIETNSRKAVLDIAPHVASALDAGTPIVALESTIITHGMPHPQNLAMADAVENCIRESGATPATIAVIEGRLKIGLSAAERQQLAMSTNAMKLSRADIAYALLKRQTGGTTVAATMIAAELAGISVFATGGIGGVHRGGETSFDISADLEELSRTAVIVVSAGPKAILDLEKTLEVLETKGVPVIGFGTDKLPGFWSSDSDLASPLRLDSPREIAELYMLRKQIGLRGGMLVANPVPPSAQIPAAEIAGYIQTALQRAESKSISGKDVTPFLLDQIVKLTKGASLQTNIALVMENARLAARIAGEISRQPDASA